MGHVALQRVPRGCLSCVGRCGTRQLALLCDQTLSASGGRSPDSTRADGEECCVTSREARRQGGSGRFLQQVSGACQVLPTCPLLAPCAAQLPSSCRTAGPTTSRPPPEPAKAGAGTFDTVRTGSVLTCTTPWPRSGGTPGCALWQG